VCWAHNPCCSKGTACKQTGPVPSSPVQCQPHSRLPPAISAVPMAPVIPATPGAVTHCKLPPASPAVSLAPGISAAPVYKYNCTCKFYASEALSYVRNLEKNEDRSKRACEFHCGNSSSLYYALRSRCCHTLQATSSSSSSFTGSSYSSCSSCCQHIPQATSSNSSSSIGFNYSSCFRFYHALRAASQRFQQFRWLQLFQQVIMKGRYWLRVVLVRFQIC
jgi:hypothetical protein